MGVRRVVSLSGLLSLLILIGASSAQVSMPFPGPGAAACVWTTLYSSTLGLDGSGNAGRSGRNLSATISGGPYGRIRVTLQSASAGTWVVANASVGISTGVNTNTTTTPAELKFGGGSGFSLAASSTILSDVLSLSVAASSQLVVIEDTTSGNFARSSSATGFGVNDSSGATYNNATGGSVNNPNAVFGIQKVEGCP